MPVLFDSLGMTAVVVAALLCRRAAGHEQPTGDENTGQMLEMHEAATVGSIRSIRTILDQGVDPNAYCIVRHHCDGSRAHNTRCDVHALVLPHTRCRVVSTVLG